jgi:hypothetical protein
MQSPHQPEAIDLSKVLITLIAAILKNFWTIAACIALCVAVGLAYYFFSSKTYESRMIIQSDILSESYALKLGENMNAHVKDGDYDYIGTSLGLTPEEASKLREFKIVTALTPTSQTMAEKEKIIVLLTVGVSDNAILPKLQSGVISFFSSNEYVKERVFEKKKELQNYINALDRELKMMDTLKLRVLKGKFATTKIGDVSIMDFATMYEVAGDLYEKKFEAETDLALVDSIQVVEGFTRYNKPVWPKLSIVLLASLALGCVAAFITIYAKTARNTF